MFAPLPVVPCPLTLFLRADEALTKVRVRPSEQFHRVRPGVYADRTAWQSLASWDAYLVRVHAYAMQHPDAVFSHESAAALLGLPVFDEPRDIHLFDAELPKSRRFGDVCVHTSANTRDVRGGTIPTTTVADTALDLMRVLPPAYALAVGDAALRGGGALTVDLLRAMAADQVARRGAAQLVWLWPRIDGRSESVGESVSRAVIEWSGFPRPELQVWFRTEGFDDRGDFFWRRYNAIGESDGYGKYFLDGDGPLAGLKREKSREDRLRRRSDGFTRWDYGDAMRATPLQHKVSQAGVPQLHPPQLALLRTLRSNPRSLR